MDINNTQQNKDEASLPKNARVQGEGMETEETESEFKK